MTKKNKKRKSWRPTAQNRSRQWRESFILKGYYYAKKGLSRQQIAAKLGVYWDEFVRYEEEHPAFRKAMEMGKQESPRKEYAGLKIEQRKFLRAYEQTGFVASAADAAGVHKNVHYQWLRRSEEYKEAFAIAQECAIDTLEAEAIRRGRDGVRKMKFYRGRPIYIRCHRDDPEAVEMVDADGEVYYAKPYVEHEYSDNLLIKLLEANRKKFQKQGNKTEINNNTNVHVDLNKMIEEAMNRDNVIDVDYVEKKAQRYLEDNSTENELEFSEELEDQTI